MWRVLLLFNTEATLNKISSSFDSNGEKINYLYYMPDKEGPHPAVVFHPGNRLFPDDYEWLYSRLLQKGYAILALYQRGYGSGDDSINDRAGLIQQKDLERAFQVLRQMDGIQKDRIGLIGHSNGAGMSLRLAASNKDVKCAVSMSMISDWGEFVKRLQEHLPHYYKSVCEHFGGNPNENPRAYELRSCIHLADKIDIPVLFVSGNDDAITPTYQTTWMYDRLVETGNKHAKLYIVKEAGHFYEKYSFSGYKTKEVGRTIANWITEVL